MLSISVIHTNYNDEAKQPSDIIPSINKYFKFLSNDLIGRQRHCRYQIGIELKKKKHSDDASSLSISVIRTPSSVIISHRLSCWTGGPKEWSNSLAQYYTFH